MTVKDCVQALISGVQSDIHDYQALERLLQSQHAQLKARQTDVLLTQLPLQQALIAKLQQAAAARSQLLQHLGITADEHGMRLLLQRLPSNVRECLNPLWQTLNQLVERCQLQNEVNGRLLACQYEVIQRLLYGEPTYDYAPPNAGVHGAGY